MSTFQPILDAASFSPALVPASDAPVHPMRRSTDHAPADGADAPGPEPKGAEALIAEAEARGRAAAEAELRAQRAALAERERGVARLVEQLEQARAEDAEISRQLIGSLITTALGRLIGDHAVLKAAALQEAFQQVASGLVGEREVVLRVAPDQAALARELVAHRPGWQVREDVEIHSGLRVETVRGSLDRTLDAAIMAMSRAVGAWLEEGR